MTQEIWKPIPGFEGYEVSNTGKVRSYHSRGTENISPTPVREMKQHISRKSNGYRFVMLRKNGKSYNRRVHQLVMFTFVHNRQATGEK